MSTSTTRANGSWLNWGSSKTTERNERRKSRARRGALRRLETLEDRTLLNASLIIDSLDALVYSTDNATAEHLNISVSGGVYTFSSDVDIDVTLDLGSSLTFTQPTANTVEVSGPATDLTVNADFDAEINIASTDVNTSINLNSDLTLVNLGDAFDLAGLAALSAPITVTGPGTSAGIVYLSVIDSGSPLDATYTLTPTTLTADNGFGGLTYSGASNLSVSGANGLNTFDVQGTADATSTTLKAGNATGVGTMNIFTVEGTTAAAGSTLTLQGGPGDNHFVIKSASSDSPLDSTVNVETGSGSNIVDIGNLEDATGVDAWVGINNAAGGVVDVNLSNNAGTAPGDWLLAKEAISPSSAFLSGFSPNGLLVYQPDDINSLTLKNAAGQANSLTIDFSNGNPIPSASALNSKLIYDGGADSLSTETSNLILKGGSFSAETHNATAVGNGSIQLVDAAATHVNYSGVSPNSVYDVVPATNYTFTGPNSTETSILVKEGENSDDTGNVQSLLISSPDLFTDTHVANKTNITIDNSTVPGATNVTVNYGITDPVEGLLSLAVITNGSNDAANFIAPPPGVAVSLSQGDGDDQATVSVPGAAAATSTILDGEAGDNTLTLDAGGLNITPSNFTAGVGGETIVSGAPLTGGPISYVNYQHVLVTNLPPATPPIVTGATINGVQGQRLVDAIAGTFTTTAAGAKASDFSATIEWGDGTSSAGVIVQDAVDTTVFYVMGTHTYYENSPSLTTTVTVTGTGSTSFTQIINGVPVTFITPASGTASADGTAVIDNASIQLVVNSFAGVENVTPSPLDVVVATFTDLGGVNPGVADPVSRYVATINWGDGSGVTPIANSAISRNGTSNSYTIILPQHVYTTPGTYVVTVEVNDGGMPGAQAPVTATATGLAHIADAPLTAADPQPTITDATEGVLFVDEVLGSFTDGNPLATVGEYTVTIDWGDGSPLSYGRVTQPGGVGTPFFVVGSHTYANAQRTTSLPSGASPVAGPVTTDGTYPIRIYVQDTYGSAVNLSNTITVLDRTLTLTGKLNPASDSGSSNSDAITNVTQPTFFGSASEAGALVFLYATPFGGTTILIGQATADSTGAWSITSNVALADGGYEIQAQAYDSAGNTISALTDVTPDLVIDTVGPKIADVYLDNFNGQVLVTFEDFGGVSNLGVGVLQSSMIDANNYRFSMIYSPVKGYRGAPQWLVTNVNVQPGTNVGQQVATVLLNDGRPFRGGHYLLSVLSAAAANQSGVRDIAGNALDGEFYSYFPSGNNVVGGDFTARLDAVHNVNYAPKTLIGPATPVSPPGQAGQTRIIGRNIARPRADLAARLAATRAARANMLAARAASFPRLAARLA